VIVVDSSVWIDHLKDRRTPQVEKLRAVTDLDIIMVGDVVMLEVLRGLRNENEVARVETLLRRFAMARMLDADLASRAASHYRTLRAAGITISKSVDLIIGTFCIAKRHVLLHSDKEFWPMSKHLGLRSLTPPVL
jgi:predicted nucleic acid-binding protein